MDRDQIIKILLEYKKRNQTKFGIKKLGVFGSLLRDSMNIDSDIDIVIEQNIPDLFILAHIKDDLENELHRKVDIIRLRKNMNEFLAKRIETEAIYV